MLKKLTGQVNVGLDPELIKTAAQLAQLYAEGGTKTFQQFAETIKAEMPSIWDRIKAYLRSVWNQIADLMNLEEVTRADAEAVFDALDKAKTQEETTPDADRATDVVQRGPGCSNPRR